MERLDTLTAAALTGLASRNHERHGHATPSDEEIGRRAVAMANGAQLALEEIETAPAPPKPTKIKGR